jgi:cell wall-associated NlpC family hydrolase
MHRIVDLIGKEFKDGGRGPEQFDCWGLVSEVFYRFGIEIPDYKISCEAKSEINGQINAERKKWERCTGELPVPALVVVMENGICNHTGVYIGNGQFIHAREHSGVAIESLDNIVWKKRIEGVYVPGWLYD